MPIVRLVWLVSVGVVYVALLYYSRLKDKGEQSRIDRYKVKPDLHSRLDKAIRKELQEKYAKRDIIKELEKEVEQLKKWGKKNEKM